MSLETALSVAVGEKAATHILRSVSFMNCELVQNQYPKPGNHSDVEKYHSVFKKCPRSLVSQSPEKSGGEISALARSRGWVVLRMVKVGEMATVSHDFLQSLLSLEPLHHGASVLTSTILNKR